MARLTPKTARSAGLMIRVSVASSIRSELPQTSYGEHASASAEPADMGMAERSSAVTIGGSPMTMSSAVWDSADTCRCSVPPRRLLDRLRQ